MKEKNIKATADTKSVVANVEETTPVVVETISGELSEDVSEELDTENHLEEIKVLEVKTQDAEVIASNVFLAEDGTQLEFAVKHFIFDGRKYLVEEAVAEASEVLELLYKQKSSIFKR